MATPPAPTIPCWAPGSGTWAARFAIDTGAGIAGFTFAEGSGSEIGGPPDFTFAAPAEVWAKYLQAVPPRHHHSLFAMLARVPGARVEGDALGFHQHAHVLRRVLEIGKWLALGNAAPAPVSLRPSLGATPLPPATGRYVPIVVRGRALRDLFQEAAGRGRDVLCLHTAGADGRQFHRLMADERVTRAHRLVAFDLPWHGKSPPPAGAAPGAWRLDTDLYVELIMAFIAAAGLSRPIVLGASMSGEICLELALRFPDRFAGIIACEACDRMERRLNAWPMHPAVNAGFFVPEWIEGLMAPQSPTECAAEVSVALRAERAGRVLRRHLLLCRRLGRARAGGGDRRAPRRAVHADRRIRLFLHHRDVGGDGGEDPWRALPGDAGHRALPVRREPGGVRRIPFADPGRDQRGREWPN